MKHSARVWPVLAAVLLFPLIAAAQVYVRPYVRRDGTVVQGYQRTRPDRNPYNNYSTPGNFNPNTGRITGGNLERYLERQRDNRADDYLR
jgi:hypothetical protein